MLRYTFAQEDRDSRCDSTEDGAGESVLEIDENAHMNDTMGSLIRDAFLDYREVLQRELKPHQVALPQWTFLRVLWQEDGLTQKVLSHRVGIHPSTAVDTLRSLEEDGLIERRRDPDDGRAFRVHLTSKGRKSKTSLLRCAGRVDEKALMGFSDEQVETLRGLLTQVLVNLQQSTD